MHKNQTKIRSFDSETLQFRSFAYVKLRFLAIHLTSAAPYSQTERHKTNNWLVVHFSIRMGGTLFS